MAVMYLQKSYNHLVVCNGSAKILTIWRGQECLLLWQLQMTTIMTKSHDSYFWLCPLFLCHCNPHHYMEGPLTFWRETLCLWISWEFVTMDIFESRRAFQRYNIIHFTHYTMNITFYIRNKIQYLGEAKILNLSISTSRDKLAR